MSLFEIVMLICFGVAWPFSIHKSLKTVSTEGKSLVFLIIVAIGYSSGILHKFFYNYDRVIYLYALNATMVCIDIGLFVRNRRAERSQDLGSGVQ